ncbi:unnamed protein product [Auanema sp. JU1783]|nr:unnamed protein product [Auanema sp. JU1783]
MQQLIVFLALVAVAFCAPTELPKHGEILDSSCPFPNGTDKAIYSYMCSSHEQFRIDNITVTDMKGKPIYPIDPTKEFILNLYSYNNGPQIDDNKVNVTLYQYTKGWVGNSCNWNMLPTYGLLDGIDGCEFAHNCPLTSGPLVLQLPMDLSQFSVIINMLAAYKPYQLEIRLFDYNAGSKHEEIACVMAQVELS